MTSILPPAKTQFLDGNGKPLAGGFVYFYIPNTSTFKNTWQDQAQTVLNTNPVVLDASGEAIIFGSGAYRQVLYDVNNNLIWDQLTYSAASDASLSNNGVPGGAGLIGFDGNTLAQQFQSRVNRVVDSIAALRLLSSTTYTRAYVTGYYTPHDGGGGAYQYDPADSSSVDNGGTVIVAADGARWKLQVIDSVSVRQFGAKGDGTTDDTTALNNAFASPNTVFRKVTIPKGTYKATSQLSLVSNAQYIGEGDSSNIVSTASEIAIFLPTACMDIEIGNIKLSGTFSRGISTGLSSSATNIKIHDCAVSGATLVGLGYTSGILIDGGNNCWIERNRLSGNGLGASTATGNSDISFYITQNTGIHINDNQCQSSAVGFGIQCFSLDHSEIRGNNVANMVTGSSNNNGYGILVYDNAGLTTLYNSIIGNTVTNTGGTGIYVASSSYNTIQGNVCKSNSQTQSDVTLPTAGISLNGPNCSNNTVTGNTVLLSGKNGISISSASRATVTGNVVYSCSQYGIHLRGTVTEGTVTGNSVTGCNTNIFADASTLTGCSINNNVAFSSNSGWPGVSFLNLNSSTFTGNTIRNSARQGLVINNGSSNTIADNTIVDNGQETTNTYDGMSIAITQSVIDGNRCGNAVVNTQRIGIVSSGGFNCIQNNNLIGNQLDGTSISGSNNQLRGNKYTTGPSQGTAVLVGGNVTVTTTEVRTNDLIMITAANVSGTAGFLAARNINNGVNFLLDSSSGGDTRTVYWEIIH